MTVCTPSASTPKTVTVKNTGVSDLVISDISITGTNAQDFNQEANDCSVIAKGSSCTISIIFTPSSPASKESASLSISSDDPKKPVLSVKLSAIGEGGTSGGTTPPRPTDDNVMVVTVNGTPCSSSTSAFYPNKPCVSVTVCTPGTSTCQTIDDILLDTGSSGLRIFKQALNVSLGSSDAGSLAECIQYADGSSDWGPVQMASVILGKEFAVQVPVQVIDSTFGTLPALCRNPDQSPADAGFNGILGVGLFAQDCGQDCSNSSDIGMYYVCDGSGCQGTAVPLSNQVQNPVALLPKDNNGVIVELPAVPLGGVPSVGRLPRTWYRHRGKQCSFCGDRLTPPTRYGEFSTTFNGKLLPQQFHRHRIERSIFPFSPSNSLPDCASASDWFCPTSTKSFSAVNTGSSGSPSGAISFDIGNFDRLTSSSNNVFAEIGGNDPDYFDWGLPFHFGRNIYIGLEGTESSLGSGTYWAY